MPYVIIFAAFAWLPRAVSLALWLLLPVLAALFISGGNPLVLLFAPVFGHFAGGQSAVFGMLGLWGYRKHTKCEDIAGGAWLGLTMLKPQLGFVPLAFAAMGWWESLSDREAHSASGRGHSLLPRPLNLPARLYHHAETGPHAG